MRREALARLARLEIPARQGQQAPLELLVRRELARLALRVQPGQPELPSPGR